MPNSFDFSQVGKNMPYRLPKGTFEQMQAQVMARIETTNDSMASTTQKAETESPASFTATRRKWLPFLAKSFAAAAAIVGLCFVIQPLFFHSATNVDSLAQESKAYDRLTPEDQAFLLEVCEDNLLLNDYTDNDQQ